MSLDYRLQTKEKQRGKLTYGDLERGVSGEFRILQNKAQADGQLRTFSLRRGKEKETLNFELLPQGGFLLNIYNYEKESYKRILQSLAKLAQLLHYAIYDYQTQETMERPDPETFASSERLAILEAQTNTINNLDKVIGKGQQSVFKNDPPTKD